MATEPVLGEEQAANPGEVAPGEAGPARSERTGRTGALVALTRSGAFQRGTQLLSYAVLFVLLGALVLVAVATVPVIFGYHPYVVEGGSMAPSLEAGSVAVAKPTSRYALEVGDVIARDDSPGGAPTLHRIIDITDVDGERFLTTQGDANSTPDPQPVVLRGPGDRVVYSVPYAGYILGFSRSWPGRFLLVVVPLGLLSGLVLHDKWRASLRQGRPAESERAPAGVPGAPGERLFQPGGQTVLIVLAGVSGSRDLVQAERALSSFPGAERVALVGFEKGAASFEMILRPPLRADDIVEGLREFTGWEVLVEETEPEVLRVRFAGSADQDRLLRAA